MISITIFLAAFFTILFDVVISENFSFTTEFNEDFIKQPYYVDKSELLGEFFKTKYGPDYNYVSYPSKFGKTHNLQMIKRFCQVELDSEKRPINWTQTTSYQIFRNLTIFRNRDVLSAHLARHPVIWLDLNFTFEGGPGRLHDQVIVRLNEQIKKSYSEYRWLVELARQNPNTYYYNEMMEKALEGTLSKQELKESLLNLAHLLNDYFKIGVVLLVDNYDLVLNTMFVYQRNERLVLKPLTMIILKTCLQPQEHYVSHALISGISMWNYNLKDYENATLSRSISVKTHPFLLDDRFAAYFGFNQPQMVSLCDQYKCTDDEIWLLKQLYDGYTSPNLFQSDLKSLYNPFSVTEFITNRKTEMPFRNYWIRSLDTNFIYQFLRGLHFRKQFVELLKYESIFIGPRDALPTSYCTFDHLRTWYEPYNSSFLGYFFDSGFLTYDARDFNRVRIPNDDIKQFLSSVLVQFFKENNYTIDELRKCFEELLVLENVFDSNDILLSIKQYVNSTLKLMNTKYGVEINSTSANVTEDDDNNNGSPRVWIFKPEVIRVEIHNVIMAVATEMHLKGIDMLVARISREYPSRDHILLNDRNETLIVRIRDDFALEPALPSYLRDALLPEMSRIRVKILDVIITDEIVLDVWLRDYKDNRSYPLSDSSSTRKIAMETLLPV